MSAHATTAMLVTASDDRERRHRLRLLFCALLALGLVVMLAVYGFDYYALGKADRPFSPKHRILKPSGTVGLKLGMLGFGMFLLIYLYAVRKRWRWLGSRGSSRHWLDFHVLLGLTAPLIIAFHSSFKIHGLAGMAFWIMVAVALSGVVGRYLYAQIPRSLSAAELSLKELQEIQQELTQQLAGQKLFSAGQLAPLFRLPAEERVRELPILRALGLMMIIDLARPFHVLRLRMRALSWSGRLLRLGGLLPAGNAELEGVVRSARRQAALSKRILFLSRSQQVFHLWHVVHRPFSYSFAVLVTIHILVVLLLGYV